MAASDEHAFRCLFRNILDDLFLVHRIIELAREMYQLEKKIVDIKVERPVGSFLASEFFVKLIDTLFYHLCVIFNNRTYNLIDGIFTQDDACMSGLGILIEIDLLFIMESGNTLKSPA